LYNFEPAQISDAPSFLQSSWTAIERQVRSIIPQIMDGVNEIMFCGCGDSHHAAHSLQYAATSFTGIPSHGKHSMEASRYWIPGQGGENTLVIGISASGEVARTIEAIEQANRMGCKTLGLSSNPESTLARIAKWCIYSPLPEIGIQPGLLSYLASLLMGFSVIGGMARQEVWKKITQGLLGIVESLPDWIQQQVAYAEQIAKDFDHSLPLVFLASGPAFGSAQFSSAKYLEATGGWSWPQDIEEWAHLEYFCDPPNLPVWFMSTRGRALSREAEVLEAAKMVRRTIFHTEWEGIEGFTDWENEVFSPFTLWPGPYSFSTRIMQVRGEKPFRGFAGGRSIEEGGGVSRIRSSWRIEQGDAWRPDAS
jgi:glucosamine--fructose-6-phosphate aminotransferase (isomerizing)